MNAARRLLRAGALAVVATALLAAVAGCNKRVDMSAVPGSGDAAQASPASSKAFTILAGSELKDIEPALVQAGKDAGVEVRLTYAGTLDIVERINAGDSSTPSCRPTARTPPRAATKPLAREKLFYSRVALGVKADKLKALGWDQARADLARHRRRASRASCATR